MLVQAMLRHPSRPYSWSSGRVPGSSLLHPKPYASQRQNWAGCVASSSGPRSPDRWGGDPPSTAEALFVVVSYAGVALSLQYRAPT